MDMVVFGVGMEDDQIRIGTIAHFIQPLFRNFGKFDFSVFPFLTGYHRMELLALDLFVSVGMYF